MLLYIVQPYYRNMLESATAYVQLEQERDDLRAALEQSKRKRPSYW